MRDRAIRGMRYFIGGDIKIDRLDSGVINFDVFLLQKDASAFVHGRFIMR
jgi:hypothetical protein